MVSAIHQHESAIGIYVSPLSWTPLPPPSPLYPARLSQSTSFGCPASRIKLALVTYFTYSNVSVSMLFSQIVLPSPPTESKCLFSTSVSSLLPCIKDCQYHLSKFHIYMLIYSSCLSLSDLFHSIIGSKFIHLIRTDSNVFVFIAE